MKMLKYIVFRILLALRRVIFSITRLLAFLFFSAAILMFVFDGFHAKQVDIAITAALLGLITLIINWLYDYLLFYLAPDDLEVTLFN
jgi:hypothetical protein